MGRIIHDKPGYIRSFGIKQNERISGRYNGIKQGKWNNRQDLYPETLLVIVLK
jgi:hypothetical protein